MSTKTTINWILFFITASMLTSASALNTIRIEEGQELLTACLRYIGAIALIQSMLLYLARYFGVYAFSAVFSHFLAYNILSLNLLFYVAVSRLDAVYIISIYILTAFVITAFSASNIKKANSPTVKAYLLFAAIFLAPLASMQPNDSLVKQGMVPVSETTYWNSIKLKSKPNIYLLSFDSLIPKEVAAKYLDIPFSDYEKIFSDYSVIPRGLTFTHSTSPTLNAIMQLDQVGRSESLYFFNGVRASALESLFHANGYRVVTGYADRFFGNVGDHIDEYLSLYRVPVSDTRLCLDSYGSTTSQMRFHFICKAYYRLIPNSLLHNILFNDETVASSFGPDGMQSQNEWYNLILEQIRKTGLSEQPTVSFLYMYRPIGHVMGTYRHTDKEDRIKYRQYFRAGLQQLEQQLTGIQKTIFKYDPSAIVLIFGDHGAHMSIGMEYSEDDPFILEDRFRVMHALMITNNHCSKLPTNHYAREYATTSRIILDIISCLCQAESLDDENIQFMEDKTIANKIFAVK